MFGRKRLFAQSKRKMRFRVTLVNGDVREFDADLTSFREMVSGAVRGNFVFDGIDNVPGAIGVNLAHAVTFELLEVYANRT